ncbi:MAG: hypothetical protein JXD23_06700 [Spirochaetales bacterium]|nr:hypothetical protein [Spirochaetales bacterium]
MNGLFDEYAASFAFDAAAAQYNRAQAQLNLIETQLANTVIISPIDGTATRPAFSVRDVVQPSQTILAVNNLDKVRVTANFEETKVGRIDFTSIPIFLMFLRIIRNN